MTIPTQAIIHRIEWKLIGFGIGIRPFWWQYGHVKMIETHWFNVGPLFIQWKVPLK